MLSFASGPWAGSCWALLGQAGEKTPRFCAAFLEMQSVMTRSPTGLAFHTRSAEWTVQEKWPPPSKHHYHHNHNHNHQAEVYLVRGQFGASQCPHTCCNTVSLTSLWDSSSRMAYHSNMDQVMRQIQISICYMLCVSFLISLNLTLKLNSKLKFIMIWMIQFSSSSHLRSDWFKMLLDCHDTTASWCVFHAAMIVQQKHLTAVSRWWHLLIHTSCFY